MKCLRCPITGEIRRVTEYTAKHLAASGWAYVSKGTWKRSVRPDLTKAKAKAAELAKAMPTLRRV